MPESPNDSTVKHRVRAQFVRALYRYLEEVGPEKTAAVMRSWADAVDMLYAYEQTLETEA